MKNKWLLIVISYLLTNLFGCSAPHQPLRVHATADQVQKPNGCVMQAGQCKPPGV